MRHLDSVSLTLARRSLLLLVASVFVLGSGVLSLGLRAVPRAELAALAAAVLYVVAASVLQPPAGRVLVSLDRIRPLALGRQLSRSTVRFCLVTSLLISLAVPWVWITAFRPTPTQLRLMAPHLFLMMAQVLFEIWSYRATVSVVIRVGIPVAFVSYRIKLLVTWVRAAAVAVGEGTGSWGDQFMLGLAAVNLAFWGFILFYVLLLKVCPPYFVERKTDKRGAPHLKSA